MEIAKIKKILKDHGQEHLLKYFDELDIKQQDHLIRQIMDIDFDEINELYQLTKKKSKTKGSNIKPLPAETNIKSEWIKLGKKLIKAGKYAVITLAGGQGTRLGFNGPKGTFILKEINKSLFEIQCDQLKDMHQKYGVYVNWFIMTSHENHDATIKFFEENNYFNYPKDKITFFKQGLLPMLHTNGKIIMDAKDNIKLGPNGQGGSFKALIEHGIIKKLEKEKVAYVFIGGIDNILQPINNPALIGYTKAEKLLSASISVFKNYPEEKVGVFAYQDDKPSIIEYINIGDELAHQKDDNGNLVYADANIVSHLFDIKVFKELKDKPLPYHVAFKKCDYLDGSGKLKSPKKENAYKFECFIFDIFPYIDRIGVLRLNRSKVFAPIKNKDGIDSPASAIKLYKAAKKQKPIIMIISLIIATALMLWYLWLYFDMLKTADICRTPTLGQFPIGIKLLFLLLVSPIGVSSGILTHLLTKNKSGRDLYQSRLKLLTIILFIITPIIIFIFGRFSLIWCIIPILPILLLMIYNGVRYLMRN